MYSVSLYETYIEYLMDHSFRNRPHFYTKKYILTSHDYIWINKNFDFTIGGCDFFLREQVKKTCKGGFEMKNPTLWPCYSFAFFSSFSFQFPLYMNFFQGDILNVFILKPFPMSEFAGFKKIYTFIYIYWRAPLGACAARVPNPVGHREPHPDQVQVMNFLHLMGNASAASKSCEETISLYFNWLDSRLLL